MGCSSSKQVSGSPASAERRQLVKRGSSINLDAAIKELEQTQQIGTPTFGTALSSASRSSSILNSVESFRIAARDVQLGRKIGEGGMGDVHLATYAGRTVVAKKSKVEQMPSIEAALAEVVSELQFAVQLRNPNCVEVYGAVMETELLLVMEYCENGSVRSKLDASHPALTPGMRVRILEQAAHGLKYLSDKGIVHRDVKAANILLDSAFNAKIADFGIAKHLAEIGAEEGISGTVPFMAPELFVQGGQPSEKSDVYAFGCFALEVLGGVTPWQGETSVQALAQKVVNGERPQVPATVHDVWKLVLLFCWQPDPNDRPSFEDLLQLIKTIREKLVAAGQLQMPAEGAVPAGGGASGLVAALGGADDPEAAAALLQLISQAQNDDASNWPGKVQKRSAVRLSARRAAQTEKLSARDVGVVARRDGKNYVVNFPEVDEVICAPADVYVDPAADKVRAGARVMLRPDVKEPKFGMGNLEHGMVGFVLEVGYDAKVAVNFGFSPTGAVSENMWAGVLSELQVVGPTQGSWRGAFQCGQAVRVKLALEKPSTGWAGVKKGSVGIVRAYELHHTTFVYTVDFPERDGWRGRESDLELDAVANVIRPGAHVCVRSQVDAPSKGWGDQGVSHRSAGRVRSVSHDGVVRVDFAEHSNWVGLLSEMTTTSPAVSCVSKVLFGGLVRC